MLITTTPDLHHVILADVIDPNTGVPKRSFSTSEQLIEFLKVNPDVYFQINVRQIGNEIIGDGSEYLDTVWTLPNSQDILCPNRVRLTNGRIEYHAHLGHGGG